MGYNIPIGYSRVTYSYQPVATTGSAIAWGFGCNVPASQEFATDLAEFWYDNVQPSTANFMRCLSVECRDVVYAAEAPVGQYGINDSDYPPPATAALIKLTSGLVGRANRGRIYLPGFVNEANISDDGQLSPAALANVQDLADNLVDFLAARQATLVVLHGTELTPTTVTAAVAQGQVATQRRRNRR